MTLFTAAAAPKPTCLITGATDGVGKVTALELAKRGFSVVLAARNAAKAATVTQEIVTATGNAGVEFVVADLTSLSSVRQLADTFRHRHAHLDVLINNAGVFLPKRTVTEDGFETTYQVNYLSHFLLTQLLLEDIKRSAQGRVINLSSSVYSVGKFDPDNLQSEKHFSVLGAYAASKLFMLMFTEELAKRLRGTRVTTNAAHPGIVRTPMMFRAPGAFRVMSYLSLPFSISPESGAKTSVHLASSPALRDVSGHYFTSSKRSDTKNKFDTETNRELLWDISMKSVHGDAPPSARRAS
jgi:NAD(P)-dependent dehydrogenase (short-subunit alcohol dehydrogenase family)